MRSPLRHPRFGLPSQQDLDEIDEVARAIAPLVAAVAGGVFKSIENKPDSAPDQERKPGSSEPEKGRSPSEMSEDQVVDRIMESLESMKQMGLPIPIPNLSRAEIVQLNRRMQEAAAEAQRNAAGSATPSDKPMDPGSD